MHGNNYRPGCNEYARQFAGWEFPYENWSKLPHQFIDLLPILKAGEIKTLIYILRHTWGFQEFDTPKRIAIDEFMRGRKRRDGSRMDAGTGMSKQGVVNALNSLEKRGLIRIEVDDADKARVQKSYMLHMKGLSQGDENEAGSKLLTSESKTLTPIRERYLEEETKNKRLKESPRPTASGSEQSSKSCINTPPEDMEISSSEELSASEPVAMEAEATTAKDLASQNGSVNDTESADTTASEDVLTHENLSGATTERPTAAGAITEQSDDRENGGDFGVASGQVALEHCSPLMQRINDGYGRDFVPREQVSKLARLKELNAQFEAGDENIVQLVDQLCQLHGRQLNKIVQALCIFVQQQKQEEISEAEQMLLDVRKRMGERSWSPLSATNRAKLNQTQFHEGKPYPSIADQVATNPRYRSWYKGFLDTLPLRHKRSSRENNLNAILAAFPKFLQYEREKLRRSTYVWVDGWSYESGRPLWQTSREEFEEWGLEIGVPMAVLTREKALELWGDPSEHTFYGVGPRPKYSDEEFKEKFPDGRALPHEVLDYENFEDVGDYSRTYKWRSGEVYEDDRFIGEMSREEFGAKYDPRYRPPEGRPLEARVKRSDFALDGSYLTFRRTKLGYMQPETYEHLFPDDKAELEAVLTWDGEDFYVDGLPAGFQRKKFDWGCFSDPDPTPEVAEEPVTEVERIICNALAKAGLDASPFDQTLRQRLAQAQTYEGCAFTEFVAAHPDYAEWLEDELERSRDTPRNELVYGIIHNSPLNFRLWKMNQSGTARIVRTDNDDDQYSGQEDGDRAGLYGSHDDMYNDEYDDYDDVE